MGKNLFAGLFLTFYLARQNITLKGENKLGNVNYMLDLKGILGGSLKISLQKENKPQCKNTVCNEMIANLIQEKIKVGMGNSNGYRN